MVNTAALSSCSGRVGPSHAEEAHGVFGFPLLPPSLHCKEGPMTVLHG